MYVGQAGEYGNRVPLDHDPDLHCLAERGQIEDAMNGLVERAGGLDDEIVQARFGRVDRDTGHDVGEADGGVAAGKRRVGEPAAVRQKVHRKLGRNPPAVLQQPDELVGVQGRLAASEAEGPRVVG